MNIYLHIYIYIYIYIEMVVCGQSDKMIRIKSLLYIYIMAWVHETNIKKKVAHTDCKHICHG